MGITMGRKGLTLRRKLRVLKNLTNSKSVKTTSIIMDAFLYILKLKLQLNAMHKEHLYVTQHLQEVKVEKTEKGLIEIKVACEMGKDMLVPVLEVLEKMNLNVLDAKVSCDCIFAMEAVVEELDKAPLDMGQVREAILLAIQSQA
ncbi:hypothetical protein POM88_054453 [Heracleum sosnowskyi]|uniref:Plant bHLH transcription factor ACT-like domain-containing protein n=1 Tax=Heracleum sosnowskyi TaxID=360622 RepID=A0AAD8GMQ8_9APIA|nr:hypothetical protein POM88_054453 [Heracleum sosnowskyi]